MVAQAEIPTQTLPTVLGILWKEGIKNVGSGGVEEPRKINLQNQQNKSHSVSDRMKSQSWNMNSSVYALCMHSLVVGLGCLCDY